MRWQGCDWGARAGWGGQPCEFSPLLHGSAASEVPFLPIFHEKPEVWILGEILGFKMMVVYSDVLKKYSVILEKHSVTGNIVCNLC